nr:PREDICTED: uncharacterized protein LOC100875865 [Megachile rotundata]
MKFLLPVLIAHVLQCAAAKSWNSDNYPEETFSVFGWIGYLKRLAIVGFMLAGVVLYYIPESRPHARRICYSLIDITANVLKSVLGTAEDDEMYEKIKSKCHRIRYEQNLAAQKRVSKEVAVDDEDFRYVHRSQGKRAKMFVDGDGLPIGGREKKKINAKHSKEHRQSRQRLRSSIIKEISGDPSSEIVKPVYFYSDKLEDLQKYFRSDLYNGKRLSDATLENYALLISGNPRQMAMLDDKCVKDDVIIVQDPYLKLKYKECGTSTEKLSALAEISGSEHEGPTRDYNNATELAMESYVKDVELSSIPEGDSKCSVSKPFYKSQYQCGGECCGNECFTPSVELNSRDILATSSDTKNVLKSRSTMSSKLHEMTEENNGNLHVTSYAKYNHEDGRFMKSSSLNNRKVDFRKESTDFHECEENGHRYENTCRRQKSKTSNSSKGFDCNDVPYFTDRSAEADDEISHHGERITRKHDLDEKPQRENYLYMKSSEDSIFEHVCEDFGSEPILKNRVKPALLRAVNWIFGGCPEASKCTKVGKEENHEDNSEWLH